MIYIRNGKRFNIYASQTIDGITYPDFCSTGVQAALGITVVAPPEPPADFSYDTYNVQEIDAIPYVIYTKKSQEQLDELAAQKEAQRIASLWQAAHDYEFAQVSGSAIGLLAMGVMQGKPKCIAVQDWIKTIWTEYYTRKAGASTDTDYSFAGPVPYSVPELMAELGL
jgi:hypothetical protein